MRQLHVVGLSADGTQLLLATQEGAARGSHAVTVDRRLEAALRGQAEGLAQVDVSPKDIQARLRAGASVTDVAAELGVPAARVERYAGPVFSERARLLDAVFATHQVSRQGPSERPLAVAVDTALAATPHVRHETMEWTAYRRPDGGWVARLKVVVRGRSRTAEWLQEGASVRPLDAWAGTLGHVAPVSRRRAPAAKTSVPKTPVPKTPVPTTSLTSVGKATATSVRKATRAASKAKAAPARPSRSPR